MRRLLENNREQELQASLRCNQQTALYLIFLEDRIRELYEEVAFLDSQLNEVREQLEGA